MKDDRLHRWSSPWLMWSVAGVAVVALASLAIGFVWLPGVQKDFTAAGLWASICRAAGVPAAWRGGASGRLQGSTQFVMTPELSRPGNALEVGRGATLALQCTVCHGARGMSRADAPNLAGQYPEVILKQMQDFRLRHRRSAVMEALSAGLSERDVRDLAAYYAFLPRPALPSAVDETVPALVRVGDPLRNIAPCASCHGGIDHKLGSPWLEDMPAAYLEAQLGDFARGARSNDPLGQMRNVARQLTGDEIKQLSGYYASRPDAGTKQAILSNLK